MSAIGPSDHDEFCRRDDWQEAGGKGHEKWEKRLPDACLLRTTIQRHKTDYGSDLKSKVLAQLEVDEATFWHVIQTGKPADRPSPDAPTASQPLDDWIVRALEQGRLNQPEIASLAPEEAEHLAITYFSIPTETPPGDVRQRLLDEIDTHRDGTPEHDEPRS